jgi:hypothetical protein
MLPFTNTSVSVYAYGNKIVVTNVHAKIRVDVYSLQGSKIKTIETNTDTEFSLSQGLWIVHVSAPDGQKSVKVITR